MDNHLTRAVEMAAEFEATVAKVAVALSITPEEARARVQTLIDWADQRGLPHPLDPQAHKASGNERSRDV